MHGALSCDHLEANAEIIGKGRRRLRRCANPVQAGSKTSQYGTVRPTRTDRYTDSRRVVDTAHVEERTQGLANALHVRSGVWLGRADQPPVRRTGNSVGKTDVVGADGATYG
jgi:hypothetical protein